MAKRKSLDLMVLLIVSALVITASASIYYGMLAQSTATVVAAPVSFTSGNDSAGILTLGTNNTYASLSLDAYPNVTVYDNCHALPATIQPDMTRWLYDALNSDPLHRCLKAGDNLQLNNIDIQILWPAHIQSNNLNVYSLVILIQQDNTSILIMGDAGIKAEKYLIERNLINDDINLLVIGHHGAADATTDALLQITQPAYATISVNEGNIRGYPSNQTLKRLKIIRAQVLRTDQSGDLCFNWQNKQSLSYTTCNNYESPD